MPCSSAHFIELSLAQPVASTTKRRSGGPWCRIQPRSKAFCSEGPCSSGTVRALMNRVASSTMTRMGIFLPFRLVVPSGSSFTHKIIPHHIGLYVSVEVLCSAEMSGSCTFADCEVLAVWTFKIFCCFDDLLTTSTLTKERN